MALQPRLHPSVRRSRARRGLRPGSPFTLGPEGPRAHPRSLRGIQGAPRACPGAAGWDRRRRGGTLLPSWSGGTELHEGAEARCTRLPPPAPQTLLLSPARELGSPGCWGARPPGPRELWARCAPLLGSRDRGGAAGARTPTPSPWGQAALRSLGVKLPLPPREALRRAQAAPSPGLGRPAAPFPPPGARGLAARRLSRSPPSVSLTAAVLFPGGTHSHPGDPRDAAGALRPPPPGDNLVDTPAPSPPTRPPARPDCGDPSWRRRGTPGPCPSAAAEGSGAGLGLAPREPGPMAGAGAEGEPESSRGSGTDPRPRAPRRAGEARVPGGGAPPVPAAAGPAART
ncbi:unnamed protein product [Nyctereutes procyonoides]|uniref:(raccoon dog) hypothetical protein n=1 Tax=Nyctereutes procyonoides TaxID=34880 RepID=A0A811YDL9_NYCPR|nr:unnamed protein product [Nyctereutes procyonoides]